MAKIDEKFIINLQGNNFVTYEGLLDLAHQKGIKGMITELIQVPSKDNNHTCIVHARAITESGEFHGIGDANPSNVNSFISKHLIRMAETRAKARALRDLANVGMIAIEELGDEEEDKPTVKPDKSKKSSSKRTDNPKQDIVDNSLATDKQLNYIYKLAKDKNYSSKEMSNYIKSVYKKDSSKALTKKEASEMIEMLNELGKEELPDVLK